MDSVNLSETQSTSFNCKNTASNTNPVSCVCCGSKDYMQAFPQAYCFTPLYPGIPKCKHVQGNFEENFKYQQPFFSSPPLFHPFFHNIAFPPNFCWAQNYCNRTAGNKQQNQTCEHNNVQISSNSCDSFPQEKTGFKRDVNAAFDKESQKPNNTFAYETPSSGNCFNTSNVRESQSNSFYQQFDSDNSIPWTFNPFIAPIISYCLLWNSQKPNMNGSPTYAINRIEDLNKKNNEESVSQKCSSNNNNNDSKVLSNTSNEVGNTNNNLAEKKTCSQEEGLEIDQQVESNDQNSGKSSTFLSLNSFNSFKHLEKEDQNRSPDICAEEEGEDTEIDGFDFEDQEESDECLKSNKKNPSNENSNVYFLLDSNYSLKENECKSSFESSSYTTLKVKKNNTTSEDVLLGEDSSATREKCSNSFQDSDDENVKTTPLNAVSEFKEQVASKKFIKNFTMTDQTSNFTLKEAQISAAAAGDLGGENCVGYKTEISSFNGEEGKAPYEKQTEENLESAGILLKGLRSSEEKNSDSFLEKSVSENLKNAQTVKSNIAKLTKLKDLKSDSTKSIKQNKECNQKDIGVVKRRHSCFPTDNSTPVVLDKSIKAQKTKNCTMIQQHFTGLEKQNKETNKIQTLKKDEKNLASKVRPLNVSQKATKTVCKK